MREPYLPHTPLVTGVPPYAAISLAPGGEIPPDLGVTGGTPASPDQLEFESLLRLLAEAGHYPALTRMTYRQGTRPGADTVMAYINYLASQCRQTQTQVLYLEDIQDSLHEQIYADRRARISWLSAALQDATRQMDEVPRKRRRDE
jgi:hypothetical protein